MRLINLKGIATLCAAVLLLGAAEDTRASLITFGFEATTGVPGFGDILTGFYTFESDTLDMDPSDTRGIYPGAIVAMYITVGTLDASATAPGN